MQPRIPTGEEAPPLRIPLQARGKVEVLSMHESEYGVLPFLHTSMGGRQRASSVVPKTCAVLILP